MLVAIYLTVFIFSVLVLLLDNRNTVRFNRPYRHSYTVLATKYALPTTFYLCSAFCCNEYGNSCFLCIECNINPLNPELNPICYLLALLGAHHFLHVSRIRVKLLTFRRLMSYIYIYIWSTYS